MSLPLMVVALFLGLGFIDDIHGKIIAAAVTCYIATSIMVLHGVHKRMDAIWRQVCRLKGEDPDA